MLFYTNMDLPCYQSFAMTQFSVWPQLRDSTPILSLLTGGLGTSWISTETGFHSLWWDSRMACLSRELKTSCWPVVKAPLFPCEEKCLHEQCYASLEGLN